MSSDSFSILLWCWSDVHTGATRLRIVLVDTGEEVHLANGSFLLRAVKVKGSLTERYLIRHLPTGREVYIQSGPKLLAFIKACLLGSDKPGLGDTGSSGE